jgi:RNA polymerase sigma factor (sigma-70 family)
MPRHDAERTINKDTTASPECATVSSRSFEDFFRHEYHRTARLLLATTGLNQCEAQDMAQEAFLVMFKRWGEFSTNPSARAFLTTVALRLARKHALRTLPEVVIGDASDLADALVSAEDKPGEVEQVQLILRVLGQLPRAQATTFAHTIDGLSPAEISKVLDITPETVRSNLRHARKRLTTILHNSENGNT